MNYKLPRGIVRACAGLLEACQTPEVLNAIVSAEREIGQGFATNDQAQESRSKLVKAVKLNIVNQKEYPFKDLKRQYDLPVEERYFQREKARFCHAMAKSLKFIQ